MDIFDHAVKLFEQGLTKTNYEEVKKPAKLYWKTGKKGNAEVLYKGCPAITRI